MYSQVPPGNCNEFKGHFSYRLCLVSVFQSEVRTFVMLYTCRYTFVYAHVDTILV